MKREGRKARYEKQTEQFSFFFFSVQVIRMGDTVYLGKIRETEGVTFLLI
jgi:hypothetical protein